MKIPTRVRVKPGCQSSGGLEVGHEYEVAVFLPKNSGAVNVFHGHPYELSKKAAVVLTSTGAYIWDLSRFDIIESKSR